MSQNFNGPLTVNRGDLDSVTQAVKRLDKRTQTVIHRSASVSAPPTEAEMEALLGTRTQLWDGFEAIVRRAAGPNQCYLIRVLSDRFWIEELTLAV